MMENESFELITKRPSLRDAVQNRLEEAILRGELQDGQQLVETDIAQWLGVSRGLVREAFRELEKTGLVTYNPYRGIFVRALTAERVRELYTLRKRLEEFAIELAMVNITDQDVLELDEQLNLMREAATRGNSTELIELDLQFHKKLYALSRHGMLIDILNGLGRQTHLFIVLTKVVYSIFPTLHEVAESHAPLVEALRQRDLKAAGFEIQRHINDVGSKIFEILQEKQLLEENKKPLS